jgi:signal transduction histidine kinase
VPILFEGRRIGELSVVDAQPRLWSNKEIALLEAVGRQLGTAIERLHLFDEVQRHAEELAEALARAQELDQLKDEFIQNVSHELRTPLALVHGYAALLNEGHLGELPPEQKHAVEIIARRVTMLSELVEDIALIMGAEARPLTQEPVAIVDLVRAAVADFQVVVGRAGLTLTLEVVSDVAPVLGESIYLRRVLDNLLTNAVKFTPEGKRICVRLWQEEGWAILKVADEGIGIAPDKLERVFERFYQVDGSTQRHYSGVGLGLSLVKQIVERLGGDITLESKVGHGSTFTVKLPTLEVD